MVYLYCSHIHFIDLNYRLHFGNKNNLVFYFPLIHTIQKNFFFHYLNGDRVNKYFMQCNTFISLEIFKKNHTLQILLLPRKYYDKNHINIDKNINITSYN